MLVPLVADQRLSIHARFTGHWLAGIGTLMFSLVVVFVDGALVFGWISQNQATANHDWGSALFMLLCLTPLHLILLSALTWVTLRLRGLRNLPLRRNGSRWMLLPSNGQPLAVAAIVLGVLSVPSLMLAHANGWSGSTSAMLMLWSAIISFTVLAFCHTRSLVHRETPTLILDDAAAEVIWIPSPEQSVITVPRSRLRKITIDDDSGSEHSDEPNAIFTLSWQFTDADGQLAERFIFKTRRGLEAVSLADWLEEWAELADGRIGEVTLA